jgi:hypothetical protein
MVSPLFFIDDFLPLLYHFGNISGIKKPPAMIARG